ncbi:hypothetical protein E8Q33_06375 [Methylophaga sp. SB9B]|uniref:hypothetical protein n=1 Tax=Methylophaga sp. SB9B TaxID=2570356 RepID=UPI0010A76859|nr:hypothetical protein [Methylophaga sp. SB9B]THK41903.1 hypothetical protein E8Q33_06375 [Methylophaga sp. SB9B]
MSFLSHALILWLGSSYAYAQPITFFDAATEETVQLQLTSGACAFCNLSPQAKWYFENEIIAPVRTAPSSAVTLPKWLQELPVINDDIPIWIASPDLIEQASFDDSGHSIITADGQKIV